MSVASKAVLAITMLAALGLASAGCWRGRRATYGAEPVVDARQAERLRRIAEREMSCPRDQLVPVPLVESAMEVRGCGRIREYALVCRRGRRCQWQPMVPAALLAARDLACPLESMSVAAPATHVRDLMGCGRMARYALACDAETACRWNLSSAPTSDAAATPPATYGTTYAPPPVGGPAPTASVAGEVPPPPGASEATATPAPVGDESVPPPPPGSTQPR
ncbi:MAG: hypothetical protein OHK0013_36780 [Sandaracinaceae bacterium]